MSCNGIVLCDGQVWRTRDEDIVTIHDRQDIDGLYPFGYYKNEYFYSVGENGQYYEECDESSHDLVELIELPFEVGQVWKDSCGKKVTVLLVRLEEHATAGCARIKAMNDRGQICWYLKDGTPWDWRSASDQMALVELVKEHIVDTKQPIRLTETKRRVNYLGTTEDNMVVIQEENSIPVRLVSMDQIENYDLPLDIELYALMLNGRLELNQYDEKNSIGSVKITWSPDEILSEQSKDLTNTVTVYVVKNSEGVLSYQVVDDGSTFSCSNMWTVVKTFNVRYSMEHHWEIID